MKYNVVQINPKLIQCYMNKDKINYINESYLYNVLFRWESFFKGTTPIVKYFAKELSHIKTDKNIDLRNILAVIAIGYNDYYVANNVVNVYILEDGKIMIKEKDMNFVCSCMYNGIEYINANIVKTSRTWKSAISKYKNKCADDIIFHPSFNDNFNNEYIYYLLLEYLASAEGSLVCLSDKYGMMSYFLSLYTNLITFSLIEDNNYSFASLLKNAISNQYGIMNKQYIDYDAISNFNFILMFDDISIETYNKIKGGSNNTIFYRYNNEELFNTMKQDYKYVDIIGKSNKQTFYRLRKEIFQL